MKQYLKVADVRKVLTLFNKEEISFSRMVEMLNEKVGEEKEREVLEPIKAQLDTWIEDRQVQADVFYERDDDISEKACLAMVAAYKSVKNIIEESK